MAAGSFVSHFLPFQINTTIFMKFFYKMAAVGHFGCSKFTLDHISGHFRSMQIFYFFLQNGCRRPFWMSENHFRSHFYPFHIDTQLLISWNFFDKMAAGGHFGCPKYTFDRIFDHFRSIGHFGFPKGHFGCLKITLDRVSGHFRSIQNFFFFEFFWQNGRRRPFWMGRQCQLSNSSEIFGWVMHVSSLKNVV